MPPTAAPPDTASPAAEPARFDSFELFRISVAQYHEMVAAGTLGPEDRVELLDGVLVTKMAIGTQHEFVTGTLEDLAREAAGRDAIVRKEAPLTLSDSVPEPDVAVVRGTRADYRDRHPGGGDAVLVVEVADTSLSKDRAKAGIYAAAGVPEYWIVDLAGRRIVIHRGPSPEGYREVAEVAEAATDLPGGRLAVTVDDLLGP